MSLEKIFLKADASIQPCNCIGPQRGEPVCPCQMVSVRIINGRYVMTRDLGPASTASPMDNPKEPS